jgi:uncharacterized membrane protein
MRSIHNRGYFMHAVERFHPRLIFTLAVFFLSLVALPHEWRIGTLFIVSWDLAIAVYLLFFMTMAVRSDSKTIRKRAETLDDNEWIILLMIIVAVIMSVAAIVVELAAAKSQDAHIHWQLVALTALTVVFSWSFLHSAFAFHYAHEYYGDGRDKQLYGLEFPKEESPDYWDFIYFSFVIGAAAQTADVNITSRYLRKLATIHCILAFFFNTVILGLTINISASLF